VAGADDAVRQQLEALGVFIRTQRQQAQMTLRDLAARTNVSNPYLSQIERGLHEPSVRVLRAISVALNVSLESMLVAAGVLPEEPEATRSDEPVPGSTGPGVAERRPTTEEAILADPRLTAEQRASLLAVYRSYTAGTA
jgi:transcriptional regulator with XRE-family HTH domain